MSDLAGLTLVEAADAVRHREATATALLES